MFDDMMNDGGIFNPDSKFWENWHTGFEDIKSSLNNFGEWAESMALMESSNKNIHQLHPTYTITTP